ncbi:MAG: hypothetical protein Q9M39_07255 [Sulfurovum sp.]|nr:hypothetical protein [Sulfurovum sp.]
MAKKKTKTFKKSQLLSLFVNENYQKVISKIKQFEIEGMNAEELQEIQVISYERLAKFNFELGDINRAMRDIESLLMISSTDTYKLIKLKYLCYIEHFSDAIHFAKEVIDSKNLKIKKEALFLYLLADIYNGNDKVDEKKLKLLPQTKQNYILGFNAFLQDDVEVALSFFNKCNPRAKVEKENIEAIKSILLNQDDISSKTLKPLYHFLIHGDDTNLQNTKNYRTIKKEVLSQFTKNRTKSDIENLISLKSSIPIESITKEIKDKEQQSKLIFNNIILLFEKQNNFSKALELFIKHRNALIHFVESGMLFIHLQSSQENRSNDAFIINFFSGYLKLHSKKLSEFQLDFIFIFLFKTSPKENTTKIIEEYGGEDILFLIKDITTMMKVEVSQQVQFDKIVKKYSLLRATILGSLSGFIDVLNTYIGETSKEEKERLINQLVQLLILFENCQKVHTKYQSVIFEILSNIAKLIQNFEFSKNKTLYMQLSKTIHHFMEIYNIDKADVSYDIKALFISIEKKKSIKKEKNIVNEHILSLLGDRINDYDEDDDMYDEEDLLELKEEFIERLANNEDPFHNDLEDFADHCYTDTVLEFILDLFKKAIELKRYDDSFLHELFNVMNITIEDKWYKEQLIISVKEYAKKDTITASLFLYNCITLISKKDRETLWYLKWLETYLYLVDDYLLPKDKVFNGILKHLIRVQEKKRFKSFNARFKKLIARFKDKGLF